MIIWRTIILYLGKLKILILLAGSAIPLLDWTLEKLTHVSRRHSKYVYCHTENVEIDKLFVTFSS